MYFIIVSPSDNLSTLDEYYLTFHEDETCALSTDVTIRLNVINPVTFGILLYAYTHSYTHAYQPIMRIHCSIRSNIE